VNPVLNYLQATYDLAAIHTIINTSTAVYVAFNVDAVNNPFPVVLPMIGFCASFDHPSADVSEPLDIYLHGYVSSRLMNTSRANTSETQKGLPVTVSATKIDGLVLSLTPNTHDVNFRSACVYGYATVVTDDAEKLWAMERITNSVVPDRWAHTRVPPDRAEMQSTAILKVSVIGGSGKIGHGGPKDDIKDTKREDLLDSVWTGTIPVYEVYGEPVPGEYNRVGKIPDHVMAYVQEVTETNKQHSKEALMGKRH
jgi:nitroimidazol reductase NimA-like FMN-containing flavoprotein (pyridoxamine 5'-phosphate oxidase superfamily)